MSIKTCPYCGKELPEELRFCPYCMQSLVPVKPSAVAHKHSLPWPIFLAVGLLVVLVLGICFWATPMGRQMFGGTPSVQKESAPEDLSNQAVSGYTSAVSEDQGETFIITDTGSFVPVVSQTSSGTSGASYVVTASVEGSLPDGSSVVSAASLASDPSLVASRVSSASPSSHPLQAVSSEAAIPPKNLEAYNRAKALVPAKIDAWNRAAANIGCEEYRVVGYQIRHSYEAIPLDYDIVLELQLQCGFSVTNLAWRESMDQTPGSNTGCYVNGMVVIPKAQRTTEGYATVKYLMLAAFTGHENPAFVQQFYGDQSLGVMQNMNSGVHNGNTYYNKGLYNGFFINDTAYTLLFEHEPINQQQIEQNGSNIVYSGIFRFEKNNMTAWQNAHRDYTDYS